MVDAVDRGRDRLNNALANSRIGSKLPDPPLVLVCKTRVGCSMALLDVVGLDNGKEDGEATFVSGPHVVLSVHKDARHLYFRVKIVSI